MHAFFWLLYLMLEVDAPPLCVRAAVPQGN
jgi:hypothetical protein